MLAMSVKNLVVEDIPHVMSSFLSTVTVMLPIRRGFHRLNSQISLLMIRTTLKIALLSLCRIMLPKVLLPATTALGTLLPDGREQGVLAGANVVMPNISPVECRNKYSLYNNKVSADPGSAGVLRSELQKKLAAIGREILIARGDYGDRPC